MRQHPKIYLFFLHIISYQILGLFDWCRWVGYENIVFSTTKNDKLDKLFKCCTLGAHFLD